jgi:hypothetical protein
MMGAVLALACLLWPAPAPALSLADARATAAYLEATNSSDRAALKEVPAITAAAAAYAARLEGECPGVLTGAPPTLASLALGSAGTSQARQQARQLGELYVELLFVTYMSALQPSRPTSLRYAAALARLHWSNARLTRAVHRQSSGLRKELAVKLPDVCGDMVAWRASGYQALAADTREYVAKVRTKPTSHLQSLSALLIRYGPKRAKTLIRIGDRLTVKLGRKLRPLAQIFERVSTALGLPDLTLAGPLPRGTVIGHGTTDAGQNFVASVERPRKGQACRVNLTITETSGSGGSSFGECGPSLRPVVTCERGLLRIRAPMPATTHSARLLLSNGRTIVSEALLVPPADGGPLAYYYQAVRGPTPFPVSLTELNAGEAVVGVLKLPRAHCRGR